MGLAGWRGGPDHPRLGLGADRFPTRAWTLGGRGSPRLGGLVVLGKSEEEGARYCEGESARESPPLVWFHWCAPYPRGTHHQAPNAQFPPCPLEEVRRWRVRRHKVKASRTKAKDMVKASRNRAKMSSSGSEGVAPASFDHSGEHCGPPGTSPAPVGGVIPGVALPASKAGDAPPPSLLAPAMLVRLYRVVVGVVPAPPEDANTAERFQQFLR